MVKILSKPKSSGLSVFQVVVLILCALLLQRIFLSSDLDIYTDFGLASGTAASSQLDLRNPLSIPGGKARNLPSLQVVNEELLKERKYYGGKGDRSHLGGFTEIDLAGVSPSVWKHAVTNWTVQSVLDVGCGKGTSTSWFVTHGLRTECVEGSHDAIEQSMVPDKSILTEHDFSRGPWWPETTFDMVWSVEFLEHVNVQFHYNYITTFRKAAIIMVTSSKWGGWHHVEVHNNDWWIRKYEAYGLHYDQKLTKEIRTVASDEKYRKEVFPPNGKNYNPQHIWLSMMVFVNPVVAALPQHAHLFGELGCFTKRGAPNHECGKALLPKHEASAAIQTPLDPAFFPLKLNDDQDQHWYDIIKASIKLPE